jgi:hypothetical protein
MDDHPGSSLAFGGAARTGAVGDDDLLDDEDKVPARGKR